MFLYKVFEIEFETIFEFTEPEKLGVDALILNSYNSSKTDIMFSIIAVKYTKIAQEQMQMNSTEFWEYAKLTFMATTKKPLSYNNHVILGQNIETQVIKKSIPKTIFLETGIFEIPNGEFIVLGIETVEEYYDETVQLVFSKMFNCIKTTT